MKIFLTAFLGFLIQTGFAQQVSIKYRTALDSTERLHYLVFIDSSTCKLVYPIRNHVDANFRISDLYFSYRVSNDTITFHQFPGDTNRTVKRLEKSKFIADGQGKIFDIISGYTYLDSKLVSDQYDIFSIDGKVYKQKRIKTDGYGLVRKNYQPNRRLKKRVKQLNPDNCKVNILRGKEAYDKYGRIGMNGGD